MRHQRGPVLRSRQRRGSDLEVLRVVVVQDEQPVSGIVDAVVQALPARGHHGELTLRAGRVEQPHLAGQHARAADHDVALAAGVAHVDVEAPVLLLEQDDVLLGRGADPVPPHPVGPPGVIDRHVEQDRTIQRPRAPVVSAGDLVRQQGPGGQVLDPDRKPLVAAQVGGVSQPAPVRARLVRAQSEEARPGGQLVVVQQHFLPVQRLAVLGQGRDDLTWPDRTPAVHRVLLTLDRTGVLPPVALAHRDRQVALLGPRLDLGEDLILERGEPGGDRLGVGVLGLQVGDRVRVVLVGQPGVLVGHGVAVIGPLVGNLLGRRRLGAHVRTV